VLSQLDTQALMRLCNFDSRIVLMISVSFYCVIDGVSENGTLNIYGIKNGADLFLFTAVMHVM
jgi:hypothetical protein